MDQMAIADRRQLRRKLTFWRIAAVLLVVVGAFAVYRFALTPPQQSTRPHIARVEITGLIQDDTELLERLQKIADSDSAKGLIVSISSPGGTTYGGERIFKAIRAVAAAVPGSVEVREAFAIPTTSGTGSEVTDYAVITDPEKERKYALTDRTLQPPEAILDPELVVTVPPSVTADTGMDVLTHAMEAFVSRNFNDFSDAMAEKAISLVDRWLPMVYADGKNLLAREKMHNASCMAGLAFNSAGLGLAHGISHALGAKLHLPHGRTNAIVLPHVMRFNAGLKDYKGGEHTLAARKYQRLVKVLNLRHPNNSLLDANDFILQVEKLCRDIGIPATLREAGADMELYRASKDEIIRAALADACTATNPRTPGYEDVAEILDQLSGE